MATEAETKEPMSEAVSINDAVNSKGYFFEDSSLQCESFTGGKLENEGYLTGNGTNSEEGSEIKVETVNEATEKHVMGSDEKITSDNITFKEITDVTEAHTEEKGNKSHDGTVNERLEKEETEATNEKLKDESINYSISDTEPSEKENTNEPIEIDNSKIVKREMAEQEEENLEKVVEAKEVEIRAGDIEKQEVISIAEPREVEQKPDINVLTFQEPKGDNQYEDDEPGKGNNESNLNTSVFQNPLILRETPDKVGNSEDPSTTENQREINETNINYQGTGEENVQTERTGIHNQEVEVEAMNSDKEYQAMSEGKEVLLEDKLKNDICVPERSEVKNDKNSTNETSGMNVDGIVGENDLRLKSEGKIKSPEIYEIAKEEEETVSKEETKESILESSSVTMEETTIKEVVSIKDPVNSEGYILEDTDLQSKKLVGEKLENEGYLTGNGTNLEEACEVKVETERGVAEKHAMEIDEKKTSDETTFEDITDVTEEHSEEKRYESHDETDTEKLEKEKIEAKYGILNDENINNFGSTSGAEPSEKKNTDEPIEINTSNICIIEATEQEVDNHEKVIVKEKVEVEAGSIKMQKLESTLIAEPTEIAQKSDLDVIACQEPKVANQHEDDEIGKGGDEYNLKTGDSQSPLVLQETPDQVGGNENVFSTKNEKEVDETISYQGTTEGNTQIEKNNIDNQVLDVEAIEFDKEVLLEDQHRNDIKNEKNSGNETSGMNLDGIVGENDRPLKSEGKFESSDVYEIAKEEEQMVPKEETKDSISESSLTTKEETAIKEDEEYLDGSKDVPALTKATQAEYVQENDTNLSYDDGVNQDEQKEKRDEFTSLNTGNEMQTETNLYETNDTNETSGANSFKDKERMATNIENSIENQLQQNCPDVFFDSLSAELELETVREIRNEETHKENTSNTGVGAPSIVAIKVSQDKGGEISSKDTKAIDTDFATLNEALRSDKSSQEMNIHDDHEYKEEKRLETILLKEELEDNSTKNENGIGTHQEFYEASETMETNKNEISKESAATEKNVEKEISNDPHLHESVTEAENTHVNEMEKEAIQAEKDKESDDEDLKDIDPITSINDNVDLHITPLITEEMDGADLQMADEFIKKPEKEEAIIVSAEQKSGVANQREDDEMGKGSDELNLNTEDFQSLPVSQETPDQVGDNEDVSRTKNEKEIDETINYQGTTEENVQTEKTDTDNQEPDVEAAEFDIEYQTAMSGDKEVLKEDQLKNETCVTESAEVKNAKISSGGTSRMNLDETIGEIDCQLESEGKFESSIVYETVKDEVEAEPKEGTEDIILESSSTAKEKAAIKENEDIPALTKTTQAEYLQEDGTNSSYNDQTSASISLSDGLSQDEQKKIQDEFTSLKFRNEMETEPNLHETNDMSETSGANSFNDKESIERNIGNNPDVFLNSWTAESELETERNNPSEGTHKEDISNACIRAPFVVTVNMSEDKGEEIIYKDTKARDIDFATLYEASSFDKSLQEMSIQGDHEHIEKKKLEKILLKEELEDNSIKKENETGTDKSFYEESESMETNKTKTSKEGVATEINVEKEISNDLHLHETVTEAEGTHVNEKDATQAEEDKELADEDLNEIDSITNKSDNLNIHKVPALIAVEMYGADLQIPDDLTKKPEKEEAINVTAEKVKVNIDEPFVVEEEIDSEVISVEAGTTSENECKEKHEIEASSDNKELEDDQLTIENRIQNKHESINSSKASETKENEGFKDKEYTEEDNSERETLEYTGHEKSPYVVLQDLKTTTKAIDIQDIESQNQGINNNETTEASVHSNTEAIPSNSALKGEAEHLANQLPEKDEATNITTEEDKLTELVSQLPNEAEDSSASLRIDLDSEKSKNIDTKLGNEKIEDTTQEEENDKQELPESHAVNEASELDEIIIVKENENADKENYSTKNFNQCEDTIIVEPIIESEPKHLNEEDYEGEVLAARDDHLQEQMIEENEEKDDMHKELKDTEVEPKIDLRTMNGEKEDSSDREINITENTIKENLDVHAGSQEQRQEQHIENIMPAEMTTCKSHDVSESNENESNKEKETADDVMLKFKRTTETQDLKDFHEVTRITESMIKEEENHHTRLQEEEHIKVPHAENVFLTEKTTYKSCDANESNETESIKEKKRADTDTVNPEELEQTENDDIHESEIMDTHTNNEDNLQHSEHVIPETEIDCRNQNTDSIQTIDNKLGERVITIPKNENKDSKTEENEAEVDLKGLEVATETKNIHGSEIENHDATYNNGKNEGKLDTKCQDNKSNYSDLEAVTTSEEKKEVDLNEFIEAHNVAAKEMNDTIEEVIAIPENENEDSKTEENEAEIDLKGLEVATETKNIHGSEIENHDATYNSGKNEGELDTKCQYNKSIYSDLEAVTTSEEVKDVNLNELIEAHNVTAKETNDTNEENIENAPAVIEGEVLNSCVDLEVSDNNDKEKKENIILQNKEEVVKSLEPSNERELEQKNNEINNDEDTQNGEDNRTELAAGFNHAIQSSNSVYDNEEGRLTQEALKDEVYKEETTIGAYDKVIAIPENENKDNKTEENEAEIDLKGLEVATKTKNIHGSEIENHDATYNNGKNEGELDTKCQDNMSICSDLEAVTTSEEVKDVNFVCQEDMQVEEKIHCTQEENSKIVVGLEKENKEDRDNSANLQKEELHEKPREELDGNPRDGEDKSEQLQAEQICFESCNTSNIYDNESFPERESVSEEELNDQKPENISTLIPKDFNATLESTIEKETTEFSDEKHIQKEEDTMLVESATNEKSANESNTLVCSTDEASAFEEAKDDELASQIDKEMAHDVALNGNEDPLHNNIRNDNGVFHEGISTELSKGHESKSSIERDLILVESAKIAAVSEEKDIDEEQAEESEMINVHMNNAEVQGSQPQIESLELENVGKVEQSESIMGTENTEANTALSIKTKTAEAKLINEDKAETDTDIVPVDKVMENNEQFSKQSNSLSNATEMEADDSFSKISNYWPINYSEETLNVNKMDTVEVDEKTESSLKLVHDKDVLQEKSLQEPEQNKSEQTMETEQLLDTKASPEVENDNLQEENLPFSQFLMKHILMNESDSFKTSYDEEIGDISKNEKDKHDIDISKEDEKSVPSLIVEPMHHASIVDEGAGFLEKLEENNEVQVDDNSDVKDNPEVIDNKDNDTEMFTTELPVTAVELTQNTSTIEDKAINEKPRENNEVQVDDNCDVKDNSEIIDDRQEIFTTEFQTSVVEQTQGTSIVEDKAFNEKPQENTEIQVDDKCDVKDDSELVDNKKEFFTKQLPISIMEQTQYTSIAEDKAINQKPHENNRVQLDDKSDVYDYSEVTDDKKEFPAMGLPITIDNAMIGSEFGTCVRNEEDMQNDADTPKQEDVLVPKEDMQTDVDTPKQEDLLVPKSNVEQNEKPKDEVVSENTLNSYHPVQAEESSDIASDSKINFVKNEGKEDDINNTLSEQSIPAVKDEEHIVLISAERKIQETKENSPNLMMDEQIYENPFDDTIAEKNILQRKDCNELKAENSEITEKEKQEQILNNGLNDEKTEAGLQKHQETSLVFEPETALGNQDMHKYAKENEKERTKFEAPTLFEGKVNSEVKPVKNVGDDQDILHQKNDSTEEQKLFESQKTQEVGEDNTDDEDEKQDADEHNGEDSNHNETNVESRDTGVTPTKKKSHGILSGVGSKVKRSIIKVKKAITGKSSHSETQPAK